MKATYNYDKVRNVDPTAVLAEATRAQIDHWAAKFPPDRRRSALVQGLLAAQEQNGGFLTDELTAAVAKYLDTEPVFAYEVASFYSMLHTKPCGRHEVAVCVNISCWLRGANEIMRHCEERLGIKKGESTADGSIFLKDEDECLAACCGAPVMQVDGHYHEHITTEKADEILDGLK